MEAIIVYEDPLSPDDRTGIVKMLRESDVLVPAFHISRDDLYAPATYIIDAALYGHKPVMLIDRNVFTRWVSTAKNGSPGTSEQLAAAVMVFAQCGEFLIEPNMALYEVASSQSHAVAIEEARLFYGLVNVPLCDWVDVALARRAAPLKIDDAGEGRIIPDFARGLTKWRLHYAALLKIAELELREDLKPVERVTALLEWMHSDFIFDGAALALGFHYLSPMSSRSGLLKGLRSRDRERAVLGIRNAVWDLSVISQWFELSKRPEMVPVLATQDQWLRRILKAAFISNPDVAHRTHLEEVIRMSWSGREADVILSQYVACSQDLDSMSRRKNQGGMDTAAEIERAEAYLKEWRPRGRTA